MMEERGRGEGEREGESKREAESADGWGSGGSELDRRARSELDQRAGSEWGKERNWWVSWKRKIDYEGKRKWVREREKQLLINNNKTINNII